MYIRLEWDPTDHLMILTHLFLLSISRKLVHAPRFYPFFPEKWQRKNGHEIFYSKEML